MARTYYKIDTCDKADSICILLDAGVTREQIMCWFQISDRTLRWYLKLRGRVNKVGRPRKRLDRKY